MLARRASFDFKIDVMRKPAIATPPGWDSCPSQGYMYTQQYIAGTHLYI